MLVNITAACSALCYSLKLGMLYQYDILHTPLFSCTVCSLFRFVLSLKYKSNTRSAIGLSVLVPMICCLLMTVVLELPVSAEIRHVKFGLCWRFVWKSLAPAENSDLWFLNLSYFVRAVSRTLVLEFLSCRASPLGVLTDACWGYGGQRNIFDHNQICLKTRTACPAIS